MANGFPSFRELKKFISNNQRATICEIRNHFSQKGDTTICIPKPNCKHKQYVLAYNINAEFYAHLTEFMKEKYVIVDKDPLACMISDSTIYTGPGEFLPIVLSIVK